MTTRAPRRHGDVLGHVGQAVLRPPVLGEENVKSDTVRPESCEPEGRASSDHAHPSWAESLNMLLDDQDGISLLRDFLSQEGCADIIDFWLACSGFQLAFCAPLSWSSTSMDLMNKRRLKLAKAIYRKYIISGGTVAKKIKPVTKSFINERVCRSQLDSALFQQAKQEVQEVMEVEVYPVFLKSHVFLKYTQEICNEWENHQWDINSHKQETGNDRKEPINSEQEANSKQDINGLTPETGIDKQEVNSKVQEPKSGKKEVQRFLPELVEKREWAESEMVPANHKTSEHWESGYKLKPRMILGGVKADAHKTSLLHKPHIHCIPKDVHAEPHKFAADLISRLELVQRERENWRRVKEHLHPVSTQEHDDAEVSTASPLCPAHLVPAHHGSSHSTVQLFDTHTENPEIILDQHGQCGQSVTRTPSLRSPITHTHTCPSDSDTWLYGDMAGTNQSKVLSYSRKCVCKSVTVAYYFCGEPIPYRTTVKGGFVTLAHFRELLTKKGAYRFFFKRASDEFDCGVVYEEVCEDDVILPLFEGRIVGKVERIY